jgi:hypothetical protein
VDDEDILARIQALIDEEHELRGEGGPGHAERIGELEVALDRCWDLLRQRRALRDAHLEADAAVARDEGTVEGYQQ